MRHVGDVGYMQSDPRQQLEFRRDSLEIDMVLPNLYSF